MQGQCVVAVYESRAKADEAYQAVREAGFPEDHIKVSGSASTNLDNTAGMTGGVTGSAGSEAGESSWWDWLFGNGMPQEHQRAYSSRFAEGHTAVSVYVDDAPSIASTSTVEIILEKFDPVDLQFDGGQQSATATDSVRQPSAETGSEGAQVIPLPEQELRVGKVATDEVRRVRTYVVEEPVERDVTLHDERVVIERRPSSNAAAGEPTEREYEVREHHEEPVVEKSTKATEELVVRKEAADRTERIQDTVKKTKADIDTKKR